MGKLKILQVCPLATVQDKGRFGFRKYGIPQSGAIYIEGLHIANQLVGNDSEAAGIEYALGGIRLEAQEQTCIGVFGAAIKVNGQAQRSNAVQLEVGDVAELSSPKLRYAYLAVGGILQVDKVFGSFSTYLPGGFGGYAGRSLSKGDIVISEGTGSLQSVQSRPAPSHIIHFTKGPEWNYLATGFHTLDFQIDPASNRIGIRLVGSQLRCDIKEIRSSAVVPGTIQLPPNGLPIVLMNDCQTTGGYPRIGQVVTEDIGTLGQLKEKESAILKLRETKA